MKVPTPIGVAVIAFASLCVCVVAALLWHGTDIAPLVTFVGTLVPLTIGVVVIGTKVDKVQETADNVQHQVNGKLAAQFQALHDRLDAAGVPVSIPDQRGKHEAETSGEGLTPAG